MAGELPDRPSALRVPTRRLAARRVRVNPARCRRCGQCVEICPEGLFAQRRPDLPPRVARPSVCIGCGHCVSICPHGAVEHLDFPAS